MLRKWSKASMHHLLVIIISPYTTYYRVYSRLTESITRPRPLFWRCVRYILLAVDSGDLSVLLLLDLSAAFDTVDHDILLLRLKTSFGLDGVICSWFRSYLTSRVQRVHRSSSVSASVVLHGSVLGPLLFILYTATSPSSSCSPGWRL